MNNGRSFSPSIQASPLSASSSGTGTPNFNLTPTSVNLNMASPSSYNAPTPRSLFSFTPAPSNAPSSLFSLSPQSETRVTFDSSIYSPISPASASPNFFSQFAPPKAPSGSSDSAQALLYGRTHSLEQRVDMATPSPFKMPSTNSTPFFTPHTPPLATNNSGYESPISIGSPVSRVLQFDGPSSRQKGKRAAEDDLAPSASKRPAELLEPFSVSQTLQRAPTHVLPFNMPSFDTSLSQQSPLPRSASGTLPSPVFTTPTTPATTAVQHYGFMPLPSPSAPGMAHASPSISSPSPASEPPRPQLPRDPTPVRSGQRPIASSEDLPLSLIKPSTVDLTYSSYNAALAAKSLLEDNEIDKWSPEIARESFSSESGKVESAVEDLIASVTSTSDMLHQLNLKLHIAANEVLVMHAATLHDDRLSKLNKYFSASAL